MLTIFHSLSPNCYVLCDPILSYFVILVNTKSYFIIKLCHKYIVAVIFMKPLKEKISITLDGDLLEILRSEAEKDDRCFRSISILFLRNTQKKSFRKIKTARNESFLFFYN